MGASGLLGHALCGHLRQVDVDVVATRHVHDIEIDGVKEVEFSLADVNSLLGTIGAAAPDVVAYLAGVTNVDECEGDEAHARRLHAEVPALIAAAASQSGRRFVYISTDHLWSGKRSMVTEEEPTAPLNAYARTKALGETMVMQAAPSAAVLRTNFFGVGRPWRQSLSDWMFARLRRGETVRAFTDAWFTPLSTHLLSQLILQAVAADLEGIYHAGGGERLTKYEFAQRLARWHGLSPGLIEEGRLADANLKAPRPADMSLDSGKLAAALGRPLPDLEASLHSVFGDSVR